MNEINAKGPKCARCGCRPDDPMWAYDRDRFNQLLTCLGCVADVRAAGSRITIVRRAVFRREEDL